MDGFKINKKFAERYDKYRRAEELQKLKDKYGEESESSSESEDETAEAVNPKLEKDFFNVLARVKAKDPVVYRKDAKFYEDSSDSDSEEENNGSKKKEKPLYMREYVNKIIANNENALDGEQYSGKVPDAPDSYYGKLAAIKKSFAQAADECDEKFANDDSVDSLMTIKQTKRNVQGDDDDQNDDDDDDDGKTKLDELDDYWKDPKLDDKEKYLRDFILNKKYLESESDDDEQLRHVKISNTEKEEEDFNDKQELFEYKFNTRFEQPDREFLKSFPRVIATSVRRKDDGKKKRRQQREKRKADEKKKKVEELARLKRLKREEILDKINRLKTATGNTDINFSSIDIDGDFDPEDYDKRMTGLFNDEFYSHVEEKKPEFSDIDEEESGGGSYKMQFDDYGYEQNVPECEQDDFVMDCDYVPVPKKSKLLAKTMKKKSKHSKKLIEEDKLERAARMNLNKKALNHVIEASYDDDDDDDAPECEQEGFVMDCDYESEPKSKRQLKKERGGVREERFEEMLRHRVSGADDKSVSDHLQEYYAMEFDDLIGDMPCRFKYREVQPNDYGLDATDILLADDATLNMWCPLKRVVAHRLKDEESYLKQKYKRKAKSFKKKTLFSKFYDEFQTKKKASKAKLEIEGSKKQKEAESIEEKTKMFNGSEIQSAIANVQNPDETKENEEKQDEATCDKEHTKPKTSKKQFKSKAIDKHLQSGIDDQPTNVESNSNQPEPEGTEERPENKRRNKAKTKNKNVEKPKSRKNNLKNSQTKKKESSKHKSNKKGKKFKKPIEGDKSNDKLRGLNKTRLAAYGLASEKYLSKKYYAVHLDGIKKI